MLPRVNSIQSVLNPRPPRPNRAVQRRVRVAACLAILVGSAASCSDTLEADAVVSWEEFREAAVRDVDGEEIYIVDGDIQVTLERLEELYDDYVAVVDGSAPRSAVNTVSGNVDRWSGAVEHNLTYCVSDSFGGLKARAVREMAAAARSWELATNIDFKYRPAQDGACTAGNTNVLFAVRPWSSGGARAFFPSSPASSRTVFIDYDDFDNSTINDWATLAPRITTIGVLRHELGHTLGLRHEHTRPEASACFEDNAWKALGRYDQRSVMHYQFCNGVSTTDLTLTVADQEGVRKLYGPPAVVAHKPLVPVDFDGDGRSDIGLTGPSDWQSLPTAFSTGLELPRKDGRFSGGDFRSLRV